jgi:hypothetical protein
VIARLFWAFRQVSQIAYSLLFKEAILRRLFSTFARGWPGLGLLFMRVVAGVALIAHAMVTPPSELSLGGLGIHITAIFLGMLLLAGLWTPIGGGIVAVLELWNAFSRPGDPWFHILLGSFGMALAVIGPGSWSVDARLFGWKRVDADDEKP